MQTTISILSTLPWSLKLVFGFISDVFPIFGLHRKPYLTLGAIIYSFFSVLYAISEKDDVVLLAGSLFISTLGMIMLDVMADTMVNSLLSSYLLLFIKMLIIYKIYLVC